MSLFVCWWPRGSSDSFPGIVDALQHLLTVGASCQSLSCLTLFHSTVSMTPFMHDTSHRIRVHPHPAWPRLNLSKYVNTLFTKVTCVFLEHNSTQNIGLSTHMHSENRESWQCYQWLDFKKRMKHDFPVSHLRMRIPLLEGAVDRLNKVE